MRIEKLRKEIDEGLEDCDLQIQNIRIDEVDGNKAFLEFVFNKNARACGYYDLQRMPKIDDILDSLSDIESFLPGKEKVDKNASILKKMFADENSEVKDNFIYILADSEVPEEGFSNNKSVQIVLIDGELTSIGRRAFAECSNLKQVVHTFASSKLIEIGEEAFDGCYCLDKVEVSDSLERIGNRAFRNCESLKVFRIPKKVKFIGEGAFEGCTDLNRFEISNYSLLDKADILKNCTSLKVEGFKKHLSTRNFELCFGVNSGQQNDGKSMTSPSINPDNIENRQRKSFNKKIIWIVVAVILLLWLFLR